MAATAKRLRRERRLRDLKQWINAYRKWWRADEHRERQEIQIRAELANINSPDHHSKWYYGTDTKFFMDVPLDETA